MSNHDEEERRAAALDVAFRRRALRVNGAIYARRHGPRLLPVLADGTFRARYVGQIAWFGSERDWRPEDPRRVAELAAEIGRIGRLRPDVAETCEWHAARLRELVRQHAVLAKLEAEQRTGPAWPAARERSAAEGPAVRRARRSPAGFMHDARPARTRGRP